MMDLLLKGCVKGEAWLRNIRKHCFERLRVRTLNNLRRGTTTARRVAEKFERAYGTFKRYDGSRMNYNPVVAAFVAGTQDTQRRLKDGSH